jgi:hypothetical protein
MQVISFDRSQIQLWSIEQIQFFRKAFKIYSTYYKNARFCPKVYREISKNYFSLKTNLPKATFDIYFPFNTSWKNAGFAN